MMLNNPQADSAFVFAQLLDKLRQTLEPMAIQDSGLSDAAKSTVLSYLALAYPQLSESLFSCLANIKKG